MSRIVLILVAATALSLLAPSAARANGVPIRIPLTYLPNLSNWGAQDARGDAELSFAEASLKVDARGLTALPNDVYQVWLAKSGTNKAVSVATLPGTADGIAGYTGNLPKLEGYDWDLLVITVEPRQDTDPTPSGKRFIGGFFTQYTRQDAPGGVDTDTRPAQLPRTGEAAPVATAAPAPQTNDRQRAALMLFGVGGISLMLALRRARRRQS